MLKNEHTVVQKQLEQPRTALAEYSFIDNPRQWTIIFENVTKLAVKLSDVLRELNQFERKLIFCYINLFYVIVCL